MIDKEAEQLDSLWSNWKNNPDKTNFQNIYLKMRPEIDKASMKASYGSNIPQSAHKLYAAQAFHDALNTYKPTSGVNLKTHVFGSVQNKAKRLNYMYQDLGYKPEPRAMKVGQYQSEFENMRLSLGREPTVQELADRLSWNVKDVILTQKEVYKDLSLTDGMDEHAVIEGSKSEEVLNYIYYELSSEEQLVYDYAFGKHGKPRMTKADKRLDYTRIAKAVGFSESKVRTIWIRIGGLLKKYLER